jgi:hypothetical protein
MLYDCHSNAMRCPLNCGRVQDDVFCEKLHKMEKQFVVPKSFTIPPLRILNVAFLLSTFVINERFPVSSDPPQHYLLPANYAFAIWGVIYSFLTIFAVYQLIPSTYDSKRINQGYSYWFLVNLVANSTWIIVYTKGWIGLSVVVILMILLTLARIFIVLKRDYPSISWAEWIFTQVGISLYFAWLVAASIVNIYQFTTKATPAYIAVAIFGLCLGAAIEGGVALWAKDPLVAGVGFWAIFAIAFRWDHKQQEIAITGFALSTLLLVLSVGLTVWHFKGLNSQRCARAKLDSEAKHLIHVQV